VSLREFTSRIEVVRRTFLSSSALLAALSLAWSATSVFADASARPAAFTATAQPHTNARTLSAGILPAGTAPSLLQSQPGISELTAIGAAGSGNPAVTTPADPSIAVGASNVVEAVNSALEVTTRAGTSPVFMNISAMIKNTSGWDVQYPRVAYDVLSGRFVLTVLQFNPILSMCASQVAVMVSQSNPALAWTTRGTINIDPELGGGLELSNVSLGLTANVVVESSDYKSCSSGLPVASQTTIIQRSDLIAGTLGVNSSAFLAAGPIGMQPATTSSAQAVAYEVANGVDCSAPNPGRIAVIAITGTPDAKNLTFPCSALFGTTTSVPPPAAQKGTTAALTTGTDRFLSVSWQANVLWVAGNTGCTPTGDSQRSCVNVEAISATSGGTLGLVTGFPLQGLNGGYLYNPALSVDGAGDAVLTFDESSSTAFESMMVMGITTSVMSTAATLHTSTTFYQPGACSTCTWGDYSAAVQDPAHPTDVWVMTEVTDGNTGTGCATTSTCWNTFVGRYTFAGPTISSVSPAAGPASGGELVTVTGSDFEPGTTLNFAGNPTTLTALSLTPDSFTFTTPSSTTSGLVQAQVTDSLGTSPIGVGSGYIYVGLANYVPLTPFRILDTRPGSTCVQCSADPTLGPGVTDKVQLTGVVGSPIPTTATAVVLNVTEVAGTASSLLTVYPFGTGMPKASNLNFAPGKVIANLVTVTLGSGGAVSIYNALGSVNVIVDVEGYFTPDVATDFKGLFHPITPVRVCDTRTSCEGNVAVGSGKSIVVTVATTGGIPSNGTAGSAVVNLTGVAGSASTFLSLFPTDMNGHCTPTGTSTINLLPGAVAANRVMVKLGPTSFGGPADALCVYNAVGSINVIVDANGWYGSATATASPTGYQYQAIAPTRICDTRFASTSCSTGAIGTGTTFQRLITVAGHAGVPAFTSGTKVVAIIANLTGVAPSTATILALYPGNLSSPPGVSDLNIGVGAVVPNLAVVEVDTLPSDAHDGDVWLYNGAGSVNAILDLEGWFQ
jgi:IPT/TIG domain